MRVTAKMLRDVGWEPICAHAEVAMLTRYKTVKQRRWRKKNPQYGWRAYTFHEAAAIYKQQMKENGNA